MNRGFIIGICLIGVVSAFMSCGSDSPATPDVTITAPTIQSPESGSTIEVYNWRLEWGAFTEIVDTQRVRVLLDGQEIMVRNYDPIYNPSTHWIELGMAPRHETLEQAIFSNVQIGVRRPQHS